MLATLLVLLLAQTSTVAAPHRPSPEELRLGRLVADAQATSSHCLLKAQLILDDNLDLEAALLDAQDEIENLRLSLTSSAAPAAPPPREAEGLPVAAWIAIAVAAAVGGGVATKALWGH